MLDLRLKYEGGGAFRVAHPLDFRLANAEFEQGELLRAQVSRPRSNRQNRMFHALIEAAYENQRGGPELASWHQLKDWLLIEAGHCNVRAVELSGPLSMKEAKAAGAAIALALRSGQDYVGVVYDPKRSAFLLRTAKSVRFSAVDGDDMGEIVDRVVSIICADIVPGMDPESILDMAKTRAAA